MSAEKLVSLCFELRTQAHLNHLSTTSYSEHKALEQFYTEILELADDFAETYQGRYSLLEFESKFKMSMSKDSIYMLKQSCAWIENYRLSLKSDATDLQNILDSIIGLINRTVYKLVNLK